MSMRLILAAGLSLAAIMTTLPTAEAQQRNRVDIRQAGVSNEIAGRQRGYENRLSCNSVVRVSLSPPTRMVCVMVRLWPSMAAAMPQRWTSMAAATQL